ncbi:glycosyl hydrolase 115 family protein [Paraflavitalea sp. CAU 1676]|uniref:glycosyl hydrolase 115 family protein n=1 Tax=Paraflavitalea sp. CAU 1676 TaxID=3032598 RepID=UPI0023D9DCC4|nr:glycosyl hydrolase 115 family protein [Paraflavitalea sp. CAU 1676]MDF2193677.1 glycosyl hydrolase 115 family protein [Paraflavitalea sp. CAU 1676]
MKQTFLLITLLCSLLATNAQKGPQISVSDSHRSGYFPLVHKSNAAVIVVEPPASRVVQIAAAALQKDIQTITGQLPAIQQELPSNTSLAVIIGTIGQSSLIDQLAQQNKVSTVGIAGQWETFSVSVVDKPLPPLQQALVIIGSDARGTAFGVFEFCRMMGVSPWSWWADVHPERRQSLYVTRGSSVQGPPSVQYRGIFINDEDWGLQPWAARHLDKDVKDIGPRTYEKVFELLLRLKANYIWPGMHPCTKAFYYYPENPKLAKDYSIVVGSSHCEPMLRNNVFEWSENFEHEYGKKPGEWRYDLNKNEIYHYWEDRVKQSAGNPSTYTVGMRGIHDGHMPGPNSIPEKVKLLEQIITDQRHLLSTSLQQSIEKVPQIFCPYKEVLTIYRNNMQLPEDITIVWADDNHGYLRQLSGAREQQRNGGSGVYYHLSYWGKPEDYLWLSTISPSLISYEMNRAYDHGAKKLWVFNVGDIKPAEMEISFAMDLAWNVGKWQPNDAYTYDYHWARETFGRRQAIEVATLKSEYYLLANAGKPEHLDRIAFTDAQLDKRVDDYRQLQWKAKDLYKRIPPRLKDAYYQLILYPIAASAQMNRKILLARKSLALAAAGKDSALYYAAEAQAAFENIKALTAVYNDSISGGKWKDMMSWHPRDLPVFNMPRVATQAMIDSAKHKGPAAVATTPSKAYTFPATSYDYHKVRGVAAVIGLGLNRAGVTRVTRAPQFDTSFTNQPFTIYQFKLTPGSHTIKVKCVPTQSVNGSGKLRYAIAINDEKPQIVNLHAEADAQPWDQNVLRGYSLGKTTHTVSATGYSTLKIYLLDEGIILSEVEIE